jgi:hypothetical protein
MGAAGRRPVIAGIVVSGALLFSAGPAFAGGGDFSPAGTSPEVAGSGPISTVVGDFNGDGKRDLATANLNDDNVTIHMGDGTGNFTEKATTSPEPVGDGPGGVAQLPFDLATGDFNRDGKQDLVVANFGVDNVEILVADGTGNFTSGATPGVGDGPHGVVVADFNGDGKQDLATANQNSNDVTILIGDGSGGFAPAGTSPEALVGGTSPRALAAGDFNGDGDQDLAVVKQTGGVFTLLGDGSGNFTDTGVHPGAGSGPWSVAVGDFNGDGAPDLAVGDIGGTAVHVLLGNGSGGFTAPGTSPETVGTAPTAVAVADLDADGDEDLAVSNQNDGDVSILFGDRTGNFTAAPTSPEDVGAGPQSVVTGDFDRDGKQDLAVAANGDNSLTILINQTPTESLGDFAPAPTSPEVVGTDPMDDVRTALVGDFDENGIPDLAVAIALTDQIHVLLGDGTGNFTEKATTSPENVGDAPTTGAVGDFDKDGHQDLVVANTGSADPSPDSVTILLGDGTGNFTEKATTSPEVVGDQPRSVAVGDFNRDGTQDLAVSNGGSDNVTILIGDGTGNFTPAASSPEAAGDVAIQVEVGDYNRDGKQDLAVADLLSFDVTILLGDGAGDFTAAGTSPEMVITRPWTITTGDFDRNGIEDLAVVYQNTTTLTLLNGDGTGNFTSQNAGFLTNSGPAYVRSADLDVDGDSDLAIASGPTDNALVLLGNGSGGFTAAATSPEAADDFPFHLGIADFDRDGLPDLAVANGVGNVTVLLGQRDSDVDTVGDADDNCPFDANPGQADNDGDDEGDACDDDDDNDTIDDAADNCPLDANPGQADNDGDDEGDVCDADDDNDGVLDGTDNCPVNANGLQEDNDNDSQGDVCDPDDDNDALADVDDQCPTLAAGTASGCPLVTRDLTLKYSKKRRRFKGALTGSDPLCLDTRAVKVFKKRRGNDSEIGQTNTDAIGKYHLNKKASPGMYYSRAGVDMAINSECSAATSPTVKVR